MENKTKSDRIHELLPRLLNSRRDENWTALVEAIGGEDDRLATLIEEVRNQFFVRTASRPHLDRLAANDGISRPTFIGISDPEFRRYVPVLSYQPKQVKQIIDDLLDIFFFKEATTAFLSTSIAAPYELKDGWDLQFRVDNTHDEHVVFRTADFTSLTSITADELVAAYNRQAKYSYAVAFFDSKTKQTFVRFFTSTVGNEGSLEVVGGLANIGLELNGFLSELGTGANTQWSVSKIGDTVTFTFTGGADPGVNNLEVGDIFLSDITGNEGSFDVSSVSLQDRSFQFTNLFATPTLPDARITQTSARQSKWLRPERMTPYRAPRRALAWETRMDQINVEMPATPAIVQRGLKGGFHVNGCVSEMLGYGGGDPGFCVVRDATHFPTSGQFILEPINGIETNHADGTVVTYTSKGRPDFETRYTYTGRTGNYLTGITPSWPRWYDEPHVFSIESAVKSNNVVTCQSKNLLEVGDHVFIRGTLGIPVLTTLAMTETNSPILSSVQSLTDVATGQLVRGQGIPDGTVIVSLSPQVIMSQKATESNVTNITFAENTNGAFIVTACEPGSGTFSYQQLGLNGVIAVSPNGATASVERIGLWDSKVIVTSAPSSQETGIIGPYVWDPQAPFVLSSYTATVTNAITAGKTIKLLNISTGNELPEDGGYLIFDYGKNTQEGPVHYFYKAAENILAIDASYIFQQSHAAGSQIVVVSHQEAHTFSGTGAEYPPYLTNPPSARLILQELIRSVTSAGLYIDFLIRYPAQLYGTLAVYD